MIIILQSSAQCMTRCDQKSHRSGIRKREIFHDRKPFCLIHIYTQVIGSAYRKSLLRDYAYTRSSISCPMRILLVKVIKQTFMGGLSIQHIKIRFYDIQSA